MTEETMQHSENYIKGKVKQVFFYNEENLYTVAKIHVLETTEETSEHEIIVTGHLPKLQEEDTITVYGQFREHQRYGRQYQVQRFTKNVPSTKEGVIGYLSSSLFEGIGRKTAERIVEHLGASAVSLIMNDPAVLFPIQGISKKKALAIHSALLEHQGLESAMSFLAQYGFGPQLSIKVYQQYRESTIDVIKKNPYSLVSEVDGIGFIRADKLAEQLNFPTNSFSRIRAAIRYAIEHDCIQEGFTYVTEEDLLQSTSLLLATRVETPIEDAELQQALQEMIAENEIIREEDRIYYPSLYYAEIGIVKSLARLQMKQQQLTETDGNIDERITDVEKEIGVTYAPQQRKAIAMSVTEPFMILTGGPGTGKTTVVKAIVEMFAATNDISLNLNDYKSEKEFPIVLAAPTGRAAKRMNESTGLPASTIHRLLGWTVEGSFVHGEDDPIEGKLLIVDEFSMVDVWLANQLLKAIPTDMKVIFVGDKDQLPSVGPGQVLRDLLQSNVLPHVELNQIYRQSEDSSIVTLAHTMKNGELPSDFTDKKRDRSFIPCRSEHIIDVVKQVCANAQSKGYLAREIQVLAPMYKGPAGITALNVTLQEIFNPPKEGRREVKFGDVTYRKGDKVIQLVNQPESGVFNGDIGEIVSIFLANENTEKQELIVISFDGNEVTYQRSDYGQFMHAYCCSIHKSQGSEYPVVVLPMVKSYFRMLRRNLIYTAVTRSKKFLILCGEREAFQKGVSTMEGIFRQTTLVERLKSQFYAEETVRVKEGMSLEEKLEEMLRVAMEEEENLSPYDFM